MTFRNSSQSHFQPGNNMSFTHPRAEANLFSGSKVEGSHTHLVEVQGLVYLHGEIHFPMEANVVIHCSDVKFIKSVNTTLTEWVLHPNHEYSLKSISFHAVDSTHCRTITIGTCTSEHAHLKAFTM